MELEDYSGPYKHDLKFEDFSKEFLVKLMKLWQGAYLSIQGCWYETVAEEYGTEVADRQVLKASLKQPERVIPLYAELANIKLNTVLDSLKAIQLAPDGHTGSELFAGEVDIKDANHVIATTTKCVLVEQLEKEAPQKVKHLCHLREKDMLEKSAPQKIKHLCHGMEKPVMEKFLCNPKIKVKPLKLPPRKGPNDIFCKWELKLEK